MTINVWEGLQVLTACCVLDPKNSPDILEHVKTQLNAHKSDELTALGGCIQRWPQHWSSSLLF